MNISKIINISLSITVLFACSGKSGSQPLADPTVSYSLERSEKGDLAQVETSVVEAEVLVKAKDAVKRTITIEGKDKSVSTIAVSPAVKRFDEIKPGDIIQVTLAGALAFEVRPPNAEELANPSAIGSAASINSAELPPGLAVGSVSRIVVTITQIDLVTNSVTIRKPDGRVTRLKARYPENLKRVKVGDTVVVSYVEAAAVEIK